MYCARCSILRHFRMPATSNNMIGAIRLERSTNITRNPLNEPFVVERLTSERSSCIGTWCQRMPQLRNPRLSAIVRRALGAARGIGPGSPVLKQEACSQSVADQRPILLYISCLTTWLHANSGSKQTLKAPETPQPKAFQAKPGILRILCGFGHTLKTPPLPKPLSA